MNATLGAQIRTLRERRGLTQEQVASEMQCSRQKLARIEKGLTDISYTTITSLAKILDVRPEDITAAVESENQPVFRQDGGDPGFDVIREMVDLFYAHRRLYESTRQVVETDE